MQDGQFFWIQPTNLSEPARFINLSQIVMATFADDGIVLQLTGGVAVTLTGPVVTEFGMLIMKHSIMSNGQPPPAELFEKIMTEIKSRSMSGS